MVLDSGRGGYGIWDDTMCGVVIFASPYIPDVGHCRRRLYDTSTAAGAVRACL